MSDREVIRCPHCSLNQFMTVKKNCRRCHRLFVEPEPPAARGPAPAVKVRVEKMDFAFWMAFVLWDSRKTLGLSARDLGKRLKAPRTWISKVENLKAMPTLNSLRRFCQVLETSPAHLVRKIEFLVTGN